MKRVISVDSDGVIILQLMAIKERENFESGFGGKGEVKPGF